jgi:PPK2 family polyphosphate:nucleotide phosphotransferase
MGKASNFTTAFRVTDGRRFRLRDFDPGGRAGIKSKQRARESLAEGIQALSDLQGRLYAQDRWTLLVVLQGMDAAGKDSTIEHVMSGVNPQGCEVHSFRAPSLEELDHDYLWRAVRRLPERGRIGIFNRSYYEEVLVVRVHPELLARQHLPPGLVTDGIWGQRFEDINGFERYLGRNGVVIRKFFLHLSPDEQRRRFLARLENPEKHWKFAAADVTERQSWDAYMRAYEDMIRHTSTPHAPWYVVPADHKWVARLVVAAAIVDTLRGLDLSPPPLDPERRRALAAARATLEAEGGRT